MVRLSETCHARPHASPVTAPSQRRSDFVPRHSRKAPQMLRGAHLLRGWCLAFAGLVISSSDGTARLQSERSQAALRVAQPEAARLVFSVGVPAGCDFDRVFPTLRLRGGSDRDTPSTNRRTKLVKKRKDRSSTTDRESDPEEAVIDPVASPFFPGDDEEYRLLLAYAATRPRDAPINRDQTPLRVPYDPTAEPDPDEQKVPYRPPSSFFNPKP
jgi:hypothetical protein